MCGTVGFSGTATDGSAEKCSALTLPRREDVIRYPDRADWPVDWGKSAFLPTDPATSQFFGYSASRLTCPPAPTGPRTRGSWSRVIRSPSCNARSRTRGLPRQITRSGRAGLTASCGQLRELRAIISPRTLLYRRARLVRRRWTYLRRAPGQPHPGGERNLEALLPAPAGTPLEFPR